MKYLLTSKTAIALIFGAVVALWLSTGIAQGQFNGDEGGDNYGADSCGKERKFVLGPVKLSVPDPKLIHTDANDICKEGNGGGSCYKREHSHEGFEPIGK